MESLWALCNSLKTKSHPITAGIDQSIDWKPSDLEETLSRIHGHSLMFHIINISL